MSEFGSPEIPIVFTEVFTETPVVLSVSSRDLLIPHVDLERAMESAIVFNEDTRPHQGEYLRKQLEDFRAAVESTPGYLGVFGTGHPFYAENGDGSVAPIQEISRYISVHLPMIQADKELNEGCWPCAACQVDSELPDLKSQCNPCDKVVFKPRDLFRTLPDMDFWVVVEEMNEEVEQEIETKVKAAGFSTSDEAIKTSLTTTRQVMDALANGEMPSERLPIDLHVVTKQELIDAMAQVKQNMANGEPDAAVPISPNSLRITWGRADNPYNFTKDFIFSLTPYDWRDEELSDTLADVRAMTKQVIGGHAGEVIAKMDPKEARQLQTPAIADLLETRVMEW